MIRLWLKEVNFDELVLKPLDPSAEIVQRGAPDFAEEAVVRADLCQRGARAIKRPDTQGTLIYRPRVPAILSFDDGNDAAQLRGVYYMRVV